MEIYQKFIILNIDDRVILFRLVGFEMVHDELLVKIER
jgi:hypothetical protein